MKNYRSILLKGIDKSLEANHIQGAEAACLKEFIDEFLLESCQELCARLDLDLQAYSVKVDYVEGDLPEKFTHTLEVKFAPLTTVANISFPGVIKQIKDILSTGDDEVYIACYNLGLKIKVVA